MKKEYTCRGFEIVNFEDRNGISCSLQQSSAIADDTEGAMKNPGSSAIWLGPNDANPKRCVQGEGWIPVELPDDISYNTRAHLNRAMVKELIEHLQAWVDTGHFKE